MKMMRAISTPTARRWIGPALLVAVLAGLIALVASIAVLGAAGGTASARAAAEPTVAPVAGAVHVTGGGNGHLVRTDRVPWEYGPAPQLARTIAVHDVGPRRWLVVLFVLFLVVLVAAIAVGLAWFLLRRRTRGGSAQGAHEILERRLAEGSIDVDEFEKRRAALRGSERKPG